MISYQDFKRLFESDQEESHSVLSSILSKSHQQENDLSKFERWVSTKNI